MHGRTSTAALVITSIALLSAGAVRSAKGDETAAEFAGIEQELCKAWVERNEKAIDRLLSADWTVIDLNGHMLTKSEVLKEAFGSQDRQVESAVVDEVRVRRIGEVAIVTGRSVISGSYRGNRATVTQRFTDVFAQRDGRWQVVASQGTRVTE